MKTSAALAVIALLTGCVESRTGSQDLMFGVTVPKGATFEELAPVAYINLSPADADSLTRAVLSYPAGKEFHTIPAGKALSSKILQYTGNRVAHLSVSQWHATAALTSWFAPHVELGLKVEISWTDTAGISHTWRRDMSKNVGGYYATGDIFTSPNSMKLPAPIEKELQNFVSAVADAFAWEALGITNTPEHLHLL